MIVKSALIALIGPTVNGASARETWIRLKRRWNPRNYSTSTLSRSARSRFRCPCKERIDEAIPDQIMTVILYISLYDSPPAFLYQECNYRSVNLKLRADRFLLRSPWSRSRRHRDSSQYRHPHQ